jgi:hypothetical protein
MQFRVSKVYAALPPLLLTSPWHGEVLCASVLVKFFVRVF